VFLQTISLPYRCVDDDREFIRDVRRVYSAAVRTGFSNHLDATGVARKQKDLRDFVKARFSGGSVDAWSLHCAALEAMDLRRAGRGDDMVFGGRANLARRQKGLISRDEWREKRLRPFTSRGDRTFLGNRHFRLDANGRRCVFQMYGRKIELNLPEMLGNAGRILRQAAALAADKKINLTFRIDAKKLHVTVDPADLPAHPERRSLMHPVAGRAMGIDLNPNWIGLAVAQNRTDPSSLEATSLLQHELVKLDLAKDASAELVRETLAAVCDRAIRLCRKWGVATIAVEKGLGKLRSGGRTRSLNRLLNYWARTIFVAMLTRKARLSGIAVVEVWGGYSTTIGNLAFEAPDACASATELARRGIARLAGTKDVLPLLDEAWLAGRRKDLPLREPGDKPGAVRSWGDVHRKIKAAKTIGYRRPHPQPPAPGSDDRASLLGHAVRRLRHRGRPGLSFRPVVPKSAADSPVMRGGVSDSTRKSG
jgi:hypothetical protein